MIAQVSECLPAVSPSRLRKKHHLIREKRGKLGNSATKYCSVVKGWGLAIGLAIDLRRRSNEELACTVPQPAAAVFVP